MTNQQQTIDLDFIKRNLKSIRLLAMSLTGPVLSVQNLVNKVKDKQRDIIYDVKQIEN